MGKVILLTHEYSPFKGGTAAYCREVFEAARRVGLPFELWTHQKAEGSDIVRLRCGGSLHPWDVCRMGIELLRKTEDLKENDLVLASYGAHLAAILAVALGGLKGCRISSLLHGSEIPRLDRNGLWYRIARILFKRVSVVFCNSQYTQEFFKRSRHGGMLHLHMALAPCACSTPGMKEIQPSPRADSDFRILTFARVHPRKGQIDVATALGFLPEELKKKVVYVLAGKGDAAYLESVIQRCVQGGVRFEYMGEVPDEELAKAYASCDLFAMASRTLKNSVEGFGISFLEAAWQGKPAVAYDSGGISEAVVHQQTGLLVEEGNIEGLSSAIKRLIENPQMLQTLGEEARKRAKTFSWEKTAAAIQANLTEPNPELF